MEPTAGVITPRLRSLSVQRCRDWAMRIFDASLFAAITLLGLAVVLAYVMPLDVANPSTAYPRGAMLAGLVRTLALQMGCMLLVLSALAALRRRWRLTLATLPLLAINLGPALWSYRPRSAPVIAGESVRVMTLNLLRCNSNVDGIVAEIETEDPDILLLQECSDTWHAALRNRLGIRYPHIVYNHRRFNMGLAVFSRRPFVGPIECGDFDHSPPAAPLRAVVDIDGQPVALYNVHLFQPYPLGVATLRRAQFAGILDRLARETLPTMLIGDFNETETGPLAASLTARGYTEAFDLGGWGHGATWPDRPRLRHLPGIRIDHIYLKGRLTCSTCRVGQGPGSDHRPVIAQIGFTSPVHPAP